MASWCVFKGGKLYCQRCKQSHAIQLPIPVTEFAAATRAFEALHKTCKGAQKNA